jgi:hypothetical protein
MLLAAALIAGFFTTVAGGSCVLYAICGIGLQCAAELPPMCWAHKRREGSRWRALAPILPGLGSTLVACVIIIQYGVATAPPEAQLSYLETGGVVTGFEWWRPSNCWGFADTAQLNPGLVCDWLSCRCDIACAIGSAAGPLVDGGPASCLLFKRARLRPAEPSFIGVPVRDCVGDGDCGEGAEDRCEYGRCVCGARSARIYLADGELRRGCVNGSALELDLLLILAVLQLALLIVAAGNCCRAVELARDTDAQVHPAPPPMAPGDVELVTVNSLAEPPAVPPPPLAA